ncbi:iron-siderophore ABC transporter substrate-binding protein [Streptomyces sp. NBC_00483]|uniref:iron-siderophore ABC transporter substrate-binding protein n=1 Tax=Streptomyces sp. NBC_00483 TaxID=2975756 RepID=UPI002E194948
MCTLHLERCPAAWAAARRTAPSPAPLPTSQERPRSRRHPGRSWSSPRGRPTHWSPSASSPPAPPGGEGADLVPAYLKSAFPKKAKQLDKVADVGSRIEPNLEAIGNIKPDLILMNTAGKDAKGLYKSLSKLAPTVATQGTGLYWKQDFLLLADAVGKTEQAQAHLKKFHADAAALGHQLKKPASVSFLRMNGNRLRVFGIPSFTGSIAEDAGLARPDSQTFQETSQDISSEKLDRADADWIFYGVQGGTSKANALTKAALWPTLGAVSAKQAIAVDDDVFYLNTGPEAAREVLAQLAEHLTAKS